MWPLRWLLKPAEKKATTSPVPNLYFRIQICHKGKLPPVPSHDYFGLTFTDAVEMAKIRLLFKQTASREWTGFSQRHHKTSQRREQKQIEQRSY